MEKRRVEGGGRNYDNTLYESDCTSRQSNIQKVAFRVSGREQCVKVAQQLVHTAGHLQVNKDFPKRREEPFVINERQMAMGTGKIWLGNDQIQ